MRGNGQVILRKDRQKPDSHAPAVVRHVLDPLVDLRFGHAEYPENPPDDIDAGIALCLEDRQNPLVDHHPHFFGDARQDKDYFVSDNKIVSRGGPDRIYDYAAAMGDQGLAARVRRGIDTPLLITGLYLLLCLGSEDEPLFKGPGDTF